MFVNVNNISNIQRRLVEITAFVCTNLAYWFIPPMEQNNYLVITTLLDNGRLASIPF